MISCIARVLCIGCPPVLGALLMLIPLAAGCDRSPQGAGATGPTELRLLCGSSMTTPVQEIVSEFERAHGVKVVMDSGGSETLLPRVLAGAPADIFVCHDPFEQKIKDAGKWAGSVTVGSLRPVLMVRPGNPRGVRRIEDLARPEIKVGIGDPRYSTCGEMFVGLLEKKGIRDAVMQRVALQGRTHQEIANGCIVGPLDAVVVWNFIAVLYMDKLELVVTDDAYEDVRVTILGLNTGTSPAMRDAFLDFCRSEKVRAAFLRHGYTPSSRKPSGSAAQR